VNSSGGGGTTQQQKNDSVEQPPPPPQQQQQQQHTPVNGFNSAEVKAMFGKTTADRGNNGTGMFPLEKSPRPNEPTDLGPAHKMASGQSFFDHLAKQVKSVESGG
jgi:hypothetical protein